jgi:membrane-associated phospholipid phosphatase
VGNDSKEAPAHGARLCGLAGLVVAALGLNVYVGTVVGRLDLAAVQLLDRLRTEDVTALATGITQLGATPSVILVTCVSVAFLLLRGHWHGAVALTVAVTATQAVVYGIKALVARARPPDSAAFVDAAGYAFPSAHAASGVALYGLLALFLLRRLDGRTRVTVCGIALVGVGSLGLTRVYLGAHYPTDVLAGWLVGALVAAAAWALARAVCTRLPRIAVAP